MPGPARAALDPLENLGRRRAHLYGSTMTFTLDIDCCWKAPLRAIRGVFISDVKPPWLMRRGVRDVGSGFSVALPERMSDLCARICWVRADFAGGVASEAEAAKDLQIRLQDCLRNSLPRNLQEGLSDGACQG